MRGATNSQAQAAMPGFTFSDSLRRDSDFRSEHGLDLVFEAERVVWWLEVVHYLALLIHKELGKVPGNNLSLVSAGVVH